MKASNKGLQKFTKTEAKINKLLSLKKITRDDIKEFSKAEKACLMKVASERYNKLTGEERDTFYSKIEPITTEASRNQLWELNHIRITASIAILMKEYGRMPTKAEIAIKTGLSRPTIHKHLKEYNNHPLYLEHIEQYRLLTPQLLVSVYNYAVNGDMAAAKLYFNVVGSLNNVQPRNSTLIQHQNNYIQINGTVVSQETIMKMKPEQLQSLETLFKTGLLEP